MYDTKLCVPMSYIAQGTFHKIKHHYYDYSNVMPLLDHTRIVYTSAAENMFRFITLVCMY